MIKSLITLLVSIIAGIGVIFNLIPILKNVTQGEVSDSIIYLSSFGVGFVSFVGVFILVGLLLNPIKKRQLEKPE
jgi:hypothetical protein